MERNNLDRGTHSIPSHAVESILEIYQSGKVLDAFRQAEKIAPLKQWHGAKACVLAARLAANTGGSGLATRLAFRGWRAEQQDAEAIAQLGYEILNRRGPLALLNFLRDRRDDDQSSLRDRADLYGLQARATMDLRDFSASERLLDQAESMDPQGSWVHLQRAYLLQAQDRIEEALAVAEAARHLHPHPYYRPAVQTCAGLLQQLDRDDEAIQLLKAATAVIQSGPATVQLYSLLSENGHWSEAKQALERFVVLSPLLETPLRRWVTAQRARVHYHLNERKEAARIAALVDDDFHRSFAEKLLLTPDQQERCQLDVMFVRQHFKTCAPATLAALGEYWRFPADHVKLAEATCYDGTPAWQQRDWAEQNGWHVREFSVTYTTAIELTERGIPFAITTVDATSAHMMAVVGFDRTRSTLLLRDPSQPYIVETDATLFFERYRAFGPRGMVFIPVGERHHIDGIDLTDSSLYDYYHSLSLCLSKYDRAGAGRALDALENQAPDLWLTWQARLELAAYDGRLTLQCRCLDKLLELFPGNASRLLRRLYCMQDASRGERLQFLQAAIVKKDADPALFIALARTLDGDARYAHEARLYIKRAMRFRPAESSALSALADLLWNNGKLDEATDCYRYAANLEQFREQLYQSWFLACRQTRRTKDALTYLEDRLERFGTRSEQPALTLAWAWRQMEQPARAHEVIKKAIGLRPDDGYLLLRAASLLSSLNQVTEAEKFVAAARSKVREADWLRTCIELAESQGQFERLRELANELLGLEPLALDAHSAVARVLSRLEGPLAALKELEKARDRYPENYGLQRLIVEWSRAAGPAAVERATRELLKTDPSDAWAHRELSITLLKLKRFDEALQAAEEATRIQPMASNGFAIVAAAYSKLGKIAEARASFRHSISLSVDEAQAVYGLIDLARTDDERRSDLALVEQELIRQVVSGDGLLVYVDIAKTILNSESLLKILQMAHSERPDLWQAWSALILQLGHLQRLDEALALATEATTRFPHLTRTWLDLSTVHQWRGETQQAISAAEHAFVIEPTSARAVLAYTGVLEHQARMAEAQQVYERAERLSPRDAQVWASHAHLLWRERSVDQAFAALERALSLAPDYDWAWERLSEWSVQSGRNMRVAEFARTLVNDRPGEPRVWLMLARMLSEQEADERLAAVDRALELDRTSVEAWDLKAELLVLSERFDDAINACSEGASACTTEIHILNGRRAWIEARRNRLPEAIRLMREVLAENSSYAWGWHRLASWLMETDAPVEATVALEQLQRLRPYDALVHRQLAFLLLKQRDSKGARDAFEKALLASLTDDIAAYNLLDLQLKEDDLKGAATTFAIMQAHQPGAGTLATGISLHLAQREITKALDTFEQLCQSSDPDPWPMGAATDALQRAGQQSAALKVLRKTLRSESCNMHAGTAVVRLLASGKKLVSAAWFFTRLNNAKFQDPAAESLISALVENGRKWLLSIVLKMRDDAIRRNDRAWAQAGYGLLKFSRFKRVTEWLGDWRTHEHVEPWMLFNLIVALRNSGQWDEATLVAEHVLQHWSHREDAAQMHLFIAMEKAISGDASEAQAHLRETSIRKDVHYDRQLSLLASVAAELRLSSLSDRRDTADKLREKLDTEFDRDTLLASARDVRKTFRRVGSLFRREGAGISTWLWFKWQLNWQLSWLAAVPLLVLVAMELKSFPPVLLWLVIGMTWRVFRRS